MAFRSYQYGTMTSRPLSGSMAYPSGLGNGTRMASPRLVRRSAASNADSFRPIRVANWRRLSAGPVPTLGIGQLVTLCGVVTVVLIGVSSRRVLHVHRTAAGLPRHAASAAAVV